MKSLHGNMKDFARKMKNIWKNDEFVWKMVQRYSKYRFFDVNCILRYSKCRLSSSIPGMPGKPKFQFHVLSGWGALYIYIYML